MAYIIRPTCILLYQVMHAQRAGAWAVIVYDQIYEALITMSKPPGSPDTSIPAVFVSQKAGQLMKSLMELDEVYATITPVRCRVTQPAWQTWSECPCRIVFCMVLVPLAHGRYLLGFKLVRKEVQSSCTALLGVLTLSLYQGYALLRRAPARRRLALTALDHNADILHARHAPAFCALVLLLPCAYSA